MTAPEHWRSPRDGSSLRESPSGPGWRDAGGHDYPPALAAGCAPGIADLRVRRDEQEPWPATEPVMRAALASLAEGLDYKSALERLLQELEAERADAFQLLLKESRGGWAPLLHGGVEQALFIGNSLSGSLSALAACTEARLTSMELCPERLAFAAQRDRAHCGERVTHLLAGDGARLPFADESFDLVVLEEGLPPAHGPWRFAIEELTRICRGQLVLTVDNRYGYKRSSGLRGRYRVPGPFEYLARALRPGSGERSLRGYRQLLAEFEGLRAYSLYPHMRDFTHVVALDSPRPRLTIGPRERRNLPKLLGQALGLFPQLTPSYLFVAARASVARRPARIERLLDLLAEQLGEERGRLDVLVATRSNTALIQCSPPGLAGDAHSFPTDAPSSGRWTLHAPLSPCKRGLLAKHHRALERVARDFPSVPVPEPLFLGELDGSWLTAERRLAGLTAPHLTGQRAPTRRMFRETAAHMARLVVEPERELDQALFDELIGERFRLVRRHAGREGTRRWLDRTLDETRERLLGRRLPLMLYHGDLRSKHIQVTPDGEVLGFLDWGASEPAFLPYVDLLHLVAHQRKQEEGCSPARSWRLLTERRELREHEVETLESYLESLGLDEAYRAAIEAIYPVLVAGMAERNWDFSRPFWLHRCFGV